MGYQPSLGRITKMASIRRIVKLPLARIASRQLSLSSRTAAYLNLNPTPYERAEVDADLTALIQKEKGSWKDLTKEEKIQLYRAQFPETFKQTLTQESDGKQVFGGIAIGLALAVVFFMYLKAYVGPEAPRTINEEWRAANAEKRKLYRQNPITES